MQLEINQKARIKIIKRRLDGFKWLFSSSVLEAMSQLLVLMALSRALTPYDFGVLAGVLICVTIIQLCTQLGLGPALVHREDVTSTDFSTVLIFSLVISVVFSVMIFVYSGYVASAFNIQELKEPLMLLAFIVPIIAWTNINEFALYRKFLYKRISFANLLSYLFGFVIVGIPLSLYDFSYWSLIFAMLAQICLKFVLTINKETMPNIAEFSIVRLQALLNYGFGFALAKIANIGANQGDNFIASNLGGADMLGLYSRAFQIANLPVRIFGDVLDKLMFPDMARLQHQNEKLIKAYLGSVSISLIVALPISAITFMNAQAIVNIIFGSQWLDIVAILKILSILICARTCYRVPDTLCRATGHVYARAFRQWIYAFLIIILGIIGYKITGIEGLAAGVVIAVFANCLMMMKLSNEILKISFSHYLGYLAPALFFLAISVASYFIFSYFVSGASLLIINTTSIVSIFLFILFFRIRLAGSLTPEIFNFSLVKRKT